MFIGSRVKDIVGASYCLLEAPILWPPDAKNGLIGKDPDARKDWRQEEKGMREDEMVGWHHQLHGHEFEQAPGVGDGQGSMACCSPWGRPKSWTWLSDWTELNNNRNLIIMKNTWSMYNQDQCPWFFSITTERRQWHPTPVVLSGKSHGRRSLAGCSPWGC